MKVIALTILLPLMHAGAETECQAVGFRVVHTTSLPGPIKEQLEKEKGILWDDRTSLGVYYEGFPDVLHPENRFMAGCAVGLEDHAFHYCVNATVEGEEFGGHNITVQAFQKFYKDCNMEPMPEIELTYDDLYERE